MTLARMWLEQAEDFQLRSRVELAAGLWAGACFNCQQTVENALKSVLILWRGNFPPTHSIEQLLAECARYDSEFAYFTDLANFIGQMYSGARYVDGSGIPAVPARRYSEADANAASEYADGILTLTQAQFFTDTPDSET